MIGRRPRNHVQFRIHGDGAGFQVHRTLGPGGLYRMRNAEQGAVHGPGHGREQLLRPVLSVGSRTLPATTAEPTTQVPGRKRGARPPATPKLIKPE